MTSTTIKVVYVFLCATVACLFVAVTCDIVVNAYTMLPYYDGWVDVVIPPTWHAILLAAHNEHRIGLIITLAMLDNDVFGGKGYLLEATEILLLLVEIALFLDVLRRSRIQSFFLRVTLATAIVCTVVSATQFTNLVWSFQVGFVAAYVCGAMSIWIACMGPASRPFAIVLGSSFVAIIGSLGLGGGVLAFPCILGATVLRRMHWRAVVLAVLLCALVAATYPVAQPSVSANPGPSYVQWAQFTLTFLGAPVAAVLSNPFLGWPSLSLWKVVLAGSLTGAAILILYLSLGLRLWASVRAAWDSDERPEPEFRVNIFLFLILTFIVLSAVVVGHSRGDLGIAEAFSSRYLTPTLMGSLACLIVLGRFCRSRRRSATLTSVVLTYLVILFLSQADRLLQSRAHSEAMRRAEISVASGVDRDLDLAKIYPDSRAVKPLIKILAFRHRSIFDTAFGQVMGRTLPRSLSLGTCAAHNIHSNPLPEVTGHQVVSGDLSRRPGVSTFLIVTDAGDKVIGVGLPLHRNWILSRVLPDRPYRFEIYVLDRQGSGDDYAAHVYRVDGEAICRLSSD